MEKKKKIPSFRPSTALSGLNKLYNDLMSERNRIKRFSKGIKIVSKLKGPRNCCIVHGSWGLAQCKYGCQEHAGSDKNLSKGAKVTRDDLQRRFLAQHCVAILDNVVIIRNTVSTML